MCIVFCMVLSFVLSCLLSCFVRLVLSVGVGSVSVESVWVGLGRVGWSGLVWSGLALPCLALPCLATLSTTRVSLSLFLNLSLHQSDTFGGQTYFNESFDNNLMVAALRCVNQEIVFPAVWDLRKVGALSLSCLVSCSCLALPCLVSSHLVSSRLVLSCLVLPCRSLVSVVSCHGVSRIG